MKLTSTTFLATIVCLGLLFAAVEAKRGGRGGRSGKNNANNRRRRSGVQNPPEGACNGGCDQGQCKWDSSESVCKGSAGKANPDCWYCAVADEPVAPSDACSSCDSQWADGCAYDSSNCTKLEANSDPNCWVCTGPPAGACAYNCEVEVDQCIFDGACGDEEDVSCYFCRDPETRQPKAPADACGECGGPDAEECQTVDEDVRDCTRSERYLDESCWECVILGSGEGAQSTVGQFTTTRPPRSNRRRGRGHGRGGRRRRK